MQSSSRCTPATRCVSNGARRGTPRNCHRNIGAVCLCLWTDAGPTLALFRPCRMPLLAAPFRHSCNRTGTG
eukprot:4124415-Pyramimonas_sp.AAC.1